MNIGAVGTSYYTPYMTGFGSGRVSAGAQAEDTKAVVNPGASTEVQPGKKSSPAECETCKNRKYQDGSDEMVSYKSPTNISPETSGAKVMAHEQEHVANAYSKAAAAGGKVLQASVQLKMAVCPECGTSYVAGGTTTTQIKYPKDQYGQNRKSFDAAGLQGANFDAAV